MKNRRTIVTALLTLAALVTPIAAQAFDLTTVFGGVMNAVLLIPGYVVSFIVMPAMGLLVYLTGMILNYSVQYSVVNMASNYTATNIEYVWSVIRDLANMGFIFMLLYTAIMTALGNPGWQKAIRNLVMAAILINFSLFLTEAIIDMSNVLALFFYKAIAPNGTGTEWGIASSFMDVLGIQNLYKITQGIQGTKIVIVGIGATVVELIASMSFLAVAVMFAIRFVVLLLVIALSPLMFVGTIMPGLGSAFGQWKGALIGQAFFAPIYFVLTWVALKVAQGLYGGGANLSGAILGGANGNGTWAADTTAVGSLFSFLIIIALLMASLTVAKSFAAKSPGFVNNITSKALGYAGNLSSGTAARLGRGTFGRVGDAIANSDAVKRGIERGGAYGASARLAMLAGNKAASSSFDIRGTGMGKSLGMGAGKGSFKDDVKRRNKQAEEDIKFVGLNKRAKDAQKTAKEKEDELKRARTEAAKRAAAAHPDAAKSQELLDAEAREIRTRESMDRAATPEQRAVLEKVYLSAKSQADTLREQQKAKQETVNQAREQFIATETTNAQKAHAEAAQSAEDLSKRSEQFIEKQSEPTVTLPDWIKKSEWAKENIPTFIEASNKGVGGKVAESVGGPAKIFGLRRSERDARVKELRNKLKEKTKEEKAVEALKELSEKKEEGKDGGDKGGTNVPAAAA